MACTRVSNSIVGKIVGVHHNTASLKAAVYQQPVQVGVDAAANNFHLYKSGIMSGTCGTHLDHAVTVVGYGEANVTVNGTTSTMAYFKIKNSWTAHWGEKGYIRIAAGDTYNGGKGQCGVLAAPFYPAAVH